MSFFINGDDTLQTYNVEILTGANISLLQPPTFKPRFEYNWQDKNGVEYDNSEPLYKQSQNYTISCLIFGSDKEDVVKNYRQLLDVICVNAGFDLQSDVVVDAMHLYYQSGVIISLGNTFMQLNVTLSNNWDKVNEYGFLVNNEGEFITDNLERKIIVQK